MGGMGKTTLAQLVFNNDKIRNHFASRIWVCVGENFDLKMIARGIIESVSGNACQDLALDSMLRRLQKELEGKRFLLVLDDIWNEDEGEWIKLKCLLACGSTGSSILVTTRKEMIASLVAWPPRKALHVDRLSNDDSWAIFKRYAFGVNKEEPNKNLIAIGKDIVDKCKGVPLALETLGSLLRFKRDEKSWRHVKESETWNLTLEEGSIAAALRLSYLDLPSKLRRCFSFCAIFPKDYRIDSLSLIHLWMANGMVASDGALGAEDVGNQIVEELYWRSLFQDIRRDQYGNIESFLLHDLLHDLAQSIMEDESCVLSTTGSTGLCTRTRHLSISSQDKSHKSCKEFLENISSLQTIINLAYRCFSSFYFPSLVEHASLKALDLTGTLLEELPYSIYLLKHIRYLNLSNTYIRRLPESIYRLWNLEILNLNQCRELQELPKCMYRLKRLQHLYMKNCHRLSSMPPNVGRLTLLKTLSRFIVGKEHGLQLSELGSLEYLGGELVIKHIERVKEERNAYEANLIGKEALQALTLSWKSKSKLQQQNENIHEQVLEALRPPLKVRNLMVESYEGFCFASWMMNDIAYFRDLQTVRMEDCPNCSFLPPLYQLPFLKRLHLVCLNSLRYIINEDGLGKDICFASLESLYLVRLPSLAGIWSSSVQKEEVGDDGLLFRHLLKFTCDQCPRLSSFPPLPSLDFLELNNFEVLKSLCKSRRKSLQSLRRLRIGGIEGQQLDDQDDTLEGLNALEVLVIEWCRETVYFPNKLFQGLCWLRELWFNNCLKLKCLPSSLQHLSLLQLLSIYDCPELVDLTSGTQHLASLRNLHLSGVHDPKMVALPEGIRWIPSLKNLYLSQYSNLASLPDWLGELNSLESLEICSCRKLMFLPTSIQRLTNLKSLNLLCCPDLQRRCKRELGEDWHKIAHIPRIVHI